MHITGQRLNPIIVNDVILRLGLNQGTRTIAKELKIARSTVQKIRFNVDLFSSAYAPPSIKLSRPRSLTTAQEELILTYLQD
jgi:transposase